MKKNSKGIVILIAIIVPYLTDKGEHAMLYEINKTVYIKLKVKTSKIIIL